MRRLSLALCALAVFACHGGKKSSTTPPATQPGTQPGATQPAATQPAAPTADQVFLKTCASELASAKTMRDKIVDAATPRDVAGTLEPYNELTIVLYNQDTLASTLSKVHPDAKMREASESCVRDIESYMTELGLDRGLYEALSAVKLDGADATTKRFVERTLRDFRRAGVDKDDATRAHLKELADKEVKLGQDFERNIVEDVRKVSFDPAQLAGLPQDYVDAHKPGADGKVVITTDYPDYQPFRTYAKDPAARKELFLAYMNRAYPQNEQVLKDIIAVRQERAKILGYASYADYDTEVKMIKSGKAAGEFIDKVSKLAEKRAKRDLATLLKAKQKDDPKAKTIEEWEWMYYDELVKADQYKFSAQEVRPYFEVTKVRDGLLTVTGKVFGVTFQPATDAKVWHPSVAAYDVLRDGQVIGRIYLDLYPREGKYKHAAQMTVKRGVKGRQLPEAALVCNFPDPGKGEALMEHDQVVTMFHEFGHLMHDVLAGDQRWMYFSGVATEWDFVEAPSQLLEEWAWDPTALSLFATNAKGEAIPAEVVKRMRAADEFGQGVFIRRQMFLAATSLKFYQEDPAKLDPEKRIVELQNSYSLFPHVDGAHYETNFGHLYGYGPGYYTYMWSLVIAKDLFSEFKKKGIFDEKTAQRYRDLVLAPGGALDAADLIKAFLGRPYNYKAFEAWINQK
jgi:thimet oligopeptidase